MKYYTIAETAERLNIKKDKIAWWFNNTFNPLEEVSGIKIERINRRILISENIIEAYETFIHTHLTCKEIATNFGLPLQDVVVWVGRKLRKGQIRGRKVGRVNYVHKDDSELIQELTLNISNFMNTSEIVQELQIHRSTVLDAIHKNHIVGGIKYKSHYYAPRESVEQYKEKFLKIEDSNEYYSIGEAAEILGYSVHSLRTMIRSSKVEISAIKNNVKSTYFLLKKDVYIFKKFLEDIPSKYYTVKQIMNKYNVSSRYVLTLLSKHLADQIKWVLLLSRQLEMVVLIADFEEFYATYDKYRTEKTTDPQSIFTNGISLIVTPLHLSETKALFLDFVALRQNTSRADLQNQRMLAREFTFLFKTLMSLEKELFLLSDNEIKWLLKITTNTNQQKNLIAFLLYLQERVHTEYREKYHVARKHVANGNKDIYSLDEFIAIEKYLKNIEFHLLEALNDRQYAVTWLYSSLHLTNAWRSSDFLRLPSPDISFMNVSDFQWFYEGNRLSVEHSQRIVNTFAHTRLKVSKTGVLNRFLVNQDMLVPISTMIVICELHRRNEKEQSLMTTGTNNYTLIRHKLHEFFPPPFKFSSLKMNRSFMTHLFHKATESSESMGVALDLVQQTRRHKEQDSTAIYIQSTDRDGPLGNATVNLCNRGHFGYLYNLLIERSFALSKMESKDTLYERTLKILEYKNVFPTPYELEQFGEFLRIQQQERESLAIRVSLMSPDEAQSLVEQVYMDKLPGHTEHAQCVIYPNCTNPTATSCIGCSNMIPKNYLLLSVGIELQKRITILNGTNNPVIASREKAWIQRLLMLLQEATDTYGMEYTKTFIDYDALLTSVSEAYRHQHSLQIKKLEEGNGE
ncbi:hypothetical protein [Brevibacillus fortis]|uniref:hypothetical protein n=1 Tax=Brevibacillus fortis TaxID=2126352 RepID=UPI0038FBEB28